jgi:hypothetical protein
MVTSITEFSLFLISFWIKFSFQTVVKKYLNCATFWDKISLCGFASRLSAYLNFSLFCTTASWLLHRANVTWAQIAEMCSLLIIVVSMLSLFCCCRRGLDWLLKLLDTYTRNYRNILQSNWVTHSEDHCNYSTHEVYPVFSTRCLVTAFNGGVPFPVGSGATSSLLITTATLN